MLRTVALLVLLSMPLEARAQDPAPFDNLFRKPEVAQEPAPPRSEKSGPDFGFTAGLHLRYSIPFGSADQEVAISTIGGGAVIAIDQDLSWGDLFGSGFGWDLEVDVYIGRDKHGNFGRGEQMRYGFYVSLGHDTYDGETESGDTGEKMSLEDMTVTTLFAGAKMEQAMGKGAFMDGRMGLGLVHYSAVEGTFSAPGVDEFRTEFFEDTYTIAFEIRGHGGIELGPINLVAGLGLRLQAPPDEGSDIDMDSGLFWTFDLEVGAEIGF